MKCLCWHVRMSVSGTSCSFLQNLLEVQGVSALDETLPYSEREVLEWNLPYLLKFLEVSLHWETSVVCMHTHTH